MRRFIVAVALALSLIACASAHANGPTHRPCTSEQFRAAAKRVYLPVLAPLDPKAGLRGLKRCAPNPRTLAGMNRAEHRLALERRRARRRMLCGAPECNKRLARYKLRRGGRLDQWPCLEQLGEHESGWDAYAVNSSSGAAGIPQALGHGQPFALGDAPAQIDWFLDYIAVRYGTPCDAWAFWLAHGWY